MMHEAAAPLADQWVRRFRALAGAAGLGAGLLGVLVLAGWALDAALRVSVLPGLDGMKPNTAAAIVLLGASLWLQRRERPEWRGKRAARICALAAGLLALLALAEHLLGWNLGIGGLLFDQAARAAPGRMAPSTALSLVALALGLLLLDLETRRGWRPAQLLSLAAGTVALLGFLGYLYDDPALHGIARWTRMPQRTGAALTALGMGILLARPDRGLVAILRSAGPGGAVARGLLPTAIVLPIVLGWLRLGGQRAGLYGTEFGLAIMAFAHIVVFSLLVGAMSRSLDGIEGEKRREHEERLAAEAKFRSLLEEAPDGIIGVDREGRIVIVNRRTEKLFGYSREEILGQPVEALLPERFRERHQEHRGHYAFAPRTRPMGLLPPLYGRCKDGTEFPAEISLSSLEAGGGLLVMAIVRDVTDSLRAAESLQASEARYRSLFHRNLAGVYRATFDGRIVECNEAFARLHGYASREDILTHNATGPYPSSEEREAFMARLKAEGVLVNHESQHRRKDGKPVWILENATLVELAPPGLIEGTIVDITERKRLEEQLRQSQKMEAIGQLAGGVAHDFNNLLSVVLGYSDLLLRDLGPQHPGRGRVEQIRKAADGAAALTRQLLAFSRKQILQPKVLDLNAVLADIEKMLRRLIGEDVQQVTVFAEGLGRVMADPGQMEQVIVNLAVNARDAMPQGGKLTLETSNVEIDEAYAAAHAGARPGPHVMLAVSDTGHGMGAETLSRIFEPFFTTKEAGKGTGLGLSTVYGIVKQSGGYLAAYSEPGRGTTFKVYLPRVEGEPERLSKGNATGQTVRGGSETILLAEDEEALREIVREILEAGGYTVLAAVTPEEVLSAARGHMGSIHLMLTDVVMPGMSGRELAGRVLAVQPGARVLYMSGYTAEAISHHGVVDSGTHFIQKPFTAEALLQKLREVLDAGD